MEDRLNQMNAVLQSMQKTLECNICLDLLNKPLTTKCGHSFCTDCIGQVVKNSRNTAQCPLCMCNVTRRSLSQNSKITGLVKSVREIITSIKRDCCFEVTPSKYRPRRQPLITYEPDDSENEENDEPRRGMRKRAVTSHYQTEIPAPKPRARSAKQRILGSSGGEELNLCMDGKSEMTAFNMTPIYGDTTPVTYIANEHSYSSPTKQEPRERSGNSNTRGGQSSRGQISRGGKAKLGSVVKGKSPPAQVNKAIKATEKVLQSYAKKDKEDHMSVSQQEKDMTEFVEDALLNRLHKPTPTPAVKIGQEKSLDKVTKWLNNSSEVGFRIGVKTSTESVGSEDSSESRVQQDSDRVNSIKSSEDKSPESNVSTNKATGLKTSASLPSGSENSKSVYPSKPKFFKSKMKEDIVKDVNVKVINDSDGKNLTPPTEDDVETVIYETSRTILSTPDDPFKFIPSQKTPKQKVQAKRGRGAKSKARGNLTVSRGRVRGKGRGVLIQSLKGANIRRDSVAEFGLKSSDISHTQSTPALKGKTGIKDIDISIIKGDITLIHQGIKESTIVCERDDDDDYYGIPDSCPVNTKDEFDEFVSNVKKTVSTSYKNESDPDSEDDREANLLFVTPAQGEEITDSKIGVQSKKEPKKKAMKANQETTDSKIGVQSKKEPKKKAIKSNPPKKETQIPQTVKSKPTQYSSNKKPNLSVNVSNSRLEASLKSDGNTSSSSTSSKASTSMRKSAAEKAQAEVDALCAMFDEVDEHQLSTVSVSDDEKNWKEKEVKKENSMRQNISIHNQTLENTELNKTLPSLNPVGDVIMPPPKAPTRGRKVKFTSKLAKVHPIPRACEEDGSSFVSNSGGRSVSGRGRGKLSKGNVRYGSDLKQKILEPNKTVPVSVNIKDTKSPGWSHVTGARKDLKTRHTSLNITGGEQRNLNDTSGTFAHSSLIESSCESNVVIDDQTQDHDVEHLNSSQSKIELVNKLKIIVKQLKANTSNAELPDICETEIPNDIKEELMKNEEHISEDKLQINRKGNGRQKYTEELPVRLSKDKDKSSKDEDKFSKDENKLIKHEDKLLNNRSDGCVNPTDAPTTSKAKISRLRRKNKEEDPRELPSQNQMEEKSSKQSSQTDVKMPPRPTETEPFDCSDLIDLPVKCTPEENLSNKRKYVEDVEVQSKQPSKLARKTFSLKAMNVAENSFKDSNISKVLATRVNNECLTVSNIPKAKSSSSQSKRNDVSLHSVNSEINKSQSQSEREDISQLSKKDCTYVEPDLKENYSMDIDQADDVAADKITSQMSQDTLESKPRLPHHTMSPSVTTVHSEAASGSECTRDHRPPIIPFKAVGSLCSKRCAAAADDASKIQSCGGLGRDLCLHAIPCEVYQVLMKYMHIMTSQPQQHSQCCSTDRWKESPTENINRQIETAAESTSRQIGSAAENTSGQIESAAESTSRQIESAVNIQPESPKNSTSEEKENEYQQMSDSASGDDESEVKSENKFLHDSESQVPNSCNTEELEMAIPLPVLQVSTRSRELRGRSHTQELSQGKTNSKNTLNVKVDNLKVDNELNEEDLNLLSPNSYRLKTGLNVKVDRIKPEVMRLLSQELVCDSTDIDKSEAKGIRNKNKKAIQSTLKSSNSGVAEKIQNNKSRSNRLAASTSKNNSVGKSSVHSQGNLSQSCINSQMGESDNSQSSEKYVDKEIGLSQEDYFPSSCEIGSSQQSTSLLSAAEMSSIKSNQYVQANQTFIVDNSATRMEEKAVKTDKSQFISKRDRNLPGKTVGNTVDIEKENMKNRNSSQMNYNRPKRKPLQSGASDLENIMSQVVKENLDYLDGKTDTSEVLSELSPASSIVYSQKIGEGKSNAGISQTKRNLRDNQKHDATDVLDTSSSKERSSFRRIKRPASSSSSEDSDSENVSGRKKRKVKVLSSSSGTSLSEKVVKIEKRDEKKHQTQHLLDSEEMRDMERFDQNVWAYFGKDLIDNDRNEMTPITIDDASQGYKDGEVIPSLEDIPSTQDVMRNVEADMALINRMRQGEDAPITVDLASQSITTQDLSVNTKGLIKKVDKSLTIAENLLDGEDSIFQDICTPSAEKRRMNVNILSGMGTGGNSSGKLTGEKTDKVTKAKSRGGMDEQVVGESDGDGEGDVDNVSHSSAHSSQSEAISTQKEEQVKNEVEVLKARVRQLEAEMNKKDDEKKEGKEVSTLVDQDKKSHESDEELFLSLPEFNPSTEPSLPSSNKLGSSSSKVLSKSVPAPVRKACRLVCTGLNTTDIMSVNRFLKQIAPAGSCFQKSWVSGITHVVVKTEKDMLAQRTLKYLYGVSAGCWVISLEWILKSIASNKILAEEEFEVKDATGVPGPRRGRTCFKPLFENCEFYVKPPFLEVTIDQLKDLLELCGARIINSLTGFTRGGDGMKLMLVQTDSDHDADSYLRKYQIISVGHDWIIECIGMYSHACISQYIMGNPTQRQYTSSGISTALMEETQELGCSQFP